MNDSNERQTSLAKLRPGACAIAPAAAVPVTVSGPSSAPFTGAGATGTDPATLSIPFTEKVALLAGHAATTRLYVNPIPGSLPAYLAGLSPAARRSQALALLQQPIVTFVPGSYAGKIPDRSDIIARAALLNNLDGPTLAAFILAEQRDQSRNEDAKDLTAALSWKQANTSIGLGQVVVSTAQKNDLFSELAATPSAERPSTR